MFHRLVLITMLGGTTLAAPVASAADWFSEINYGRADFGSDFATTPDTYGIGVGTLFNDYVGAQFDWGYTGTPTPAPCPVPICVIYITPEHVMSLRVLGRLPLGDRFELIGGYGRSKAENGTYGFTQYSDMISFSAGWRINETFTLSIQRRIASVNDFTADDAALDTVSLRYGF